MTEKLSSVHSNRLLGLKGIYSLFITVCKELKGKKSLKLSLIHVTAYTSMIGGTGFRKESYFLLSSDYKVLICRFSSFSPTKDDVYVVAVLVVVGFVCLFPE